MTRRFWEAFCRGAYPGHGETYMNDEGILWWSHGGKLHGESPERFKFLQKIMEETPGHRDFVRWKISGMRLVQQ